MVTIAQGDQVFLGDPTVLVNLFQSFAQFVQLRENLLRDSALFCDIPLGTMS